MFLIQNVACNFYSGFDSFNDFIYKLLTKSLETLFICLFVENMVHSVNQMSYQNLKIKNKCFYGWEPIFNLQYYFNVTLIHHVNTCHFCLLIFTDYYFTRVTPSKLFDVLKEDFDYMFISAVLSGLVIAAYITRRLSAMRSLRQAWK